MKNVFIVLIIALSVSNVYSQTERQYYIRGITKFNLNDYKGAIADFSKAIEIYPNYGGAYYNRGRRC
ncbi:MAG: tetratricopeptide repeat protein [Bacteroidetes bacterium]|nr:tetratricopeptide repeat protein [Bacteroidota bacterium]MDA0879700.1 tetratricopeptide repeat protein [Bacteroidota bacterium]MDA1115325.1 tetratricopeptide repeat protein [Bacteroidota bacterium]